MKSYAPKQEWKLGKHQQVLPDGSVLEPGTRRKDGSYRKSTRRRANYYNEEDLERNVYKPKAVRARESGKQMVAGLGLVSNDAQRKKERKQLQRQKELGKKQRKNLMKHKYKHLVGNLAELREKHRSKYFAHCIVESFCKGKTQLEIENFRKENALDLMDAMNKTFESTPFKTLCDEQIDFFQVLLHEIELNTHRKAGGVVFDEHWEQDIKNQKEIEKELARWEKMRKNPPPRKEKAKKVPVVETSLPSEKKANNSNEKKKQLRKLTKKLRQIEKIEEKQSQGVVLNDQQLSKIKGKVDIVAQMENLSVSDN